MVDELEFRLERLGPKYIYDSKQAFRAPHINPAENFQRMPYLKSDLTAEIAKGIGSPNFSDNIYSSVNKDVLKRVYYGILSTGKLPDAFLKSLTDWEKIFLFRGRWSTRNPNLSQPIDVFVSNHLYTGLNKLNEDHFVRKANGKYNSNVKFPESDRVREDYKRIVLGEGKELFVPVSFEKFEDSEDIGWEPDYVQTPEEYLKQYEQELMDGTR